jgi:hypothetical protein
MFLAPGAYASVASHHGELIFESNQRTVAIPHLLPRLTQDSEQRAPVPQHRASRKRPIMVSPKSQQRSAFEAGPHQNSGTHAYLQ